jgi:hypothetical protein
MKAREAHPGGRLEPPPTREFRKKCSGSGSASWSQAALRPAATAAAETRSRPVGDHPVDAEGPIRGARDVRDLPAAGWPAHVEPVPPDLLAASNLEGPIGIACLDPAGCADPGRVARRRSRLPAGRSGSLWPGALSRTGSRSIRRGSRG